MFSDKVETRVDADPPKNGPVPAGNSDPQSLLGQCVMVTRPEGRGDLLAVQLRALGAEVVVQPAICISEPPDWQPVDAALAQIGQFDWLVFSSANGVRRLLDRWEKKGISPISAGGKLDLSPFSLSPFSLDGKLDLSSIPRIAAIGPGTADELARYGLRTDLLPEAFRAESLAESLCRDAAGRRFLLARASRGREVLAEQLTAAGGIVEQVVVYTSSDVATPDPDVAARLAAGRIDWITVTSSAIARSLARLFGDELRRAKLASISPITSAALRELGHEPAVEATEYTMPGLVAAIVRAAGTTAPI